MTDVRTVLSRVAPPVAADPRAADADLARGRVALRRRRAARGAGALVLVTAAAGVVRNAGPVADAPPAAAPSTAASTAPSASAAPTTDAPVSGPAVRLVAFTGKQPSGYSVEFIPAGWEVQGADPFAMTIAPVGFADRHPQSFAGKLVVMLRSVDATGDPTGKPVPVGDRTGYVDRADPTSTVLTYQDARGNWVVVQVPPSLRWSDKEVARFGAGVTVTGSAQPGRG